MIFSVTEMTKGESYRLFDTENEFDRKICLFGENCIFRVFGAVKTSFLKNPNFEYFSLIMFRKL